MPEFRMGAAGVMWFVHAGGTVQLTDQVRTVTVPQEADMIDTTSGNATTRTYIAGLGGWSMSYEGLSNGTASPMGTVDEATLVPGLSGTVIVGPFGTATGQSKLSGAALVKSQSQDFPYDDVATTSLEFQGSGALTKAVW